MIFSVQYHTVPSKFRSVLVYVLSALLLLNPVSPAIAALVTDGEIEVAISHDPQFEFLNSNSHLYQGLSHVDQEVAEIYSVEDWLDSLKGSHKHIFDSFSMVPISVGDITIFVPAFEHFKMVGTPFVQTRYVRAQVNDILQRSLINPVAGSGYDTEAAQMSTLLSNATDFIDANPQLDLKFGQALTETELAVHTKDMIWPELRILNGQQVIVPIVYITQATIDTQRVTGNTNEVYSNVSLESLHIEDVDIHVKRDAFIQIANDLTSTNGAIIGDGNLTIHAGGKVENLSSRITTEGDLAILAGEIENRTIIHRIDAGRFQDSYYSSVSSLDAGGNLVLQSYGDIFFEGATGEGESITLQANGSIRLGTATLYDGDSWSDPGRYTNELTLSYLQSGLTAEESITLLAAQTIEIDAAEIIAQEGHIEMLAGLGIVIEDELGSYSRNFKGRFGKKKVDSSVYQTVAIRSILDAGKGVKLNTAYGDITLKAADITSSEGTQVTAVNGAVNLLLTTETDHYSYSSVKKGLFTTRTRNKGHTIETGIPNRIVGGLAVEALNGINVQYEGLGGEECEDYLTEAGVVIPYDEDACLRANIMKASEMPGLEWMGEILVLADADPDAYNWEEIKTQHKTWNESNTSLSPAFGALVSIALAVAMGPAGLNVGAMVTTGTGAVATAMSAGAVALSTQASMAVLNGAVNGDIGGALQDLASSDTFRSLATTMLTAGAIKALDTAFFGLDSEGINEVIQEAEQAGKTAVEVQAAVDAAQAAEVLKTVGQSPLMQMGQAVAHATASAGIEVMVQGGSLDDFGDALGNSLASSAISRLGQEIATEIGIASKPDPNIPGSEPDINQLTRYMAHAASGCLTGSLTAGLNETDIEAGCASGAGGAIVGEAIGDLFVYANQAEVDELQDVLQEDLEFIQLLEAEGLGTPKELLAELDKDTDYYLNRVLDLEETGINLARLGAALGAFVAGAEAHEIYIAADAGENAAEHNAIPALIWGAAKLITAIGIVMTAKDLMEKGEKLLDPNTTEEEREELYEEIAIDMGIEVVLYATGTKGIDALADLIKRARAANVDEGKIGKIDELWKSKYDADNEAGLSLPIKADGLEVPVGLTPASFDMFSSSIRSKVDELGLGDDIFVQGSRVDPLGNPRPLTDVDPSDLDVSIRVSPDKFDEIVNDPNVVRKRIYDPDGNAATATRQVAIQDGRIHKGEVKGLSTLARHLEQQFGYPVDISIIKHESKFDHGFQTPLSFTFE